MIDKNCQSISLPLQKIYLDLLNKYVESYKVVIYPL